MKSQLQLHHHLQQLRSSQSLLVDLYSASASHLVYETFASVGGAVPACSSWADGQAPDTLFGDELVFDQDAAKAKLPNMELFPIRVSGPAYNRRSMAFFGDGCAFFPTASSFSRAGH